MWKWFLFSVLAFGVLQGCHDTSHAHGDDDHSHDPDHAAEEAHEHEHENETVSVTLWDQEMQVYVEFSRLVVGQESSFVSHFTVLGTHQPVASGSLLVRLHYDVDKVDMAGVPKPSDPGIFRPTITPSSAGTARVELQLTFDQHKKAFDLGTFQVFPNAEAAAAKEYQDSQEGISFSLEKQWQVSFGVTQAKHLMLRSSIPAISQIKAPSSSHTLVTSPHQGRLIQTPSGPLNIGDKVSKGNALFSLALIPSQDDVDPASLDVAVAQNQIHAEGAKKTYARAKALADQGLLDEATLDEAHEKMREAEAAYQGAARRKELFNGSQRLAASESTFAIPSPITGVITELFVPTGAWVSEGQALAKVLNREQLWLEMSVPEAYLPRIQQVHGAWFDLNSDNPSVFEIEQEAFLGQGTEIDLHTRTMPFRFRITNQNGRFYPGMTFKSYLITSAPESQLAIPYSALVREEGVDVVFIQLAGETFEKRIVQTGIRDGELITIIAGLEEGTWVVSEGAYLVKLASTGTQSLGHGHAH